MKGRLTFAALLVGTLIAVTPARAQGMKFDELMKLFGKCNVDQITVAVRDNSDTLLGGLRDAAGTPVIVKAAETDCTEGVKALIQGGVDVDLTDAQGRTALHAAAAMSTSSMVQLLVDRKADIKAKTKAGETALSLARTNNYKGKTEQRDKIVAYLTKKGAPDKQ
jgi:hypothetical protein